MNIIEEKKIISYVVAKKKEKPNKITYNRFVEDIYNKFLNKLRVFSLSLEKPEEGFKTGIKYNPEIDENDYEAWVAKNLGDGIECYEEFPSDRNKEKKNLTFERLLKEFLNFHKSPSVKKYIKKDIKEILEKESVDEKINFDSLTAEKTVDEMLKDYSIFKEKII